MFFNNFRAVIDVFISRKIRRDNVNHVGFIRCISKTKAKKEIEKANNVSFIRERTYKNVRGGISTLKHIGEKIQRPRNF